MGTSRFYGTYSENDYSPPTEFHKNVYALIHPRELKFPTKESPEVAYIKLTPNTLTDVELDLIEENFTGNWSWIFLFFILKLDFNNFNVLMVDPKDTSRPCLHGQKPLQECLLAHLECNPLDSLQNCPIRTEPIPAIDPSKTECDISACQTSKYRVVKQSKEKLSCGASPDDRSSDIDYISNLASSCTTNFGYNTTDPSVSNKLLRKLDE